jgi:transcriptional regulator with PAS, ATPase and Fis domain
VARSLALVCYDERDMKVFAEQIGALFSDSIELLALRADAVGPGALASADLVLFDTFESCLRCAGAGLPANVIFARRTISKTGLEALSGLPAGAELAVIDSTRAMAEEMASALIHLGLRGLRPLARAEAVPPGLGAAIVFCEREAAPAGLPVFDAGNCLLDVGTIIDIGVRLGLVDLLDRRNIRASYRELVTTDTGLANILGKMNRLEGSLDILLGAVDAGVVGVDAEGRIFVCNEAAKAFMGIAPGSALGADGASLFPGIPFDRVFDTRSPVKDRLKKFGGLDLVYSIDPILHSGVFYGAVAVLSRPGEEERARHRISAQLLGKGYRARYSFKDIRGTSAAIARCREIALRMADSNSSVLISGESGTGKEMFAQAIHNSSSRRDFQFVAFNCGALPQSLLESELFGYEEGAFTGARKGGKPGLFELAHRGTVFLDEIGEMPNDLQMRLLRVLEEREVMRLGGDRLISIDIRVVAATNRDLEALVETGKFREDLYYRLNVLPLRIPPLRDRPEDIMPLIREFQRIYDFDFELSAEAQRLFLAHRWRGNARELRNYVEFIANLGLRRVEPADLPFQAETAAPQPGPAAPAAAANLEAKRGFLLEELARAFRAGARLGRRSLHSLAVKRGIFLSEQEIRRLLLELETESLVVIFPGKGGTVITERGLRELERN